MTTLTYLGYQVLVNGEHLSIYSPEPERHLIQAGPMDFPTARKIIRHHRYLAQHSEAPAEA